MDFRKRSTRKLLRGVLLVNGLSYEEFSRQHGYSVNTVKKVVRRHWGRDTQPRGPLTRQILQELESYFHKGIGVKELVRSLSAL